MTFSEIYILWKAKKQMTLKPASFSTYILLTEKYILPQVGENENITETDAVTVSEKVIAQGGSNKTAADVSVLLMSILRFGAREGLCPMPTWQTKTSTISKPKSMTVLSLDEEKILLNNLVSSPNPRNLGIYLALCNGLRLGEVCGLRWQDLNIEKGYIHVRGSQGYLYAAKEEGWEWRRKTESESNISPRDIPLATGQIQFLSPLCKGHEPESFILTNTTTPIQPRTLRSYLSSLAKKLNLPAITFKDLRHTFAVRGLEVGVDFVTLAKLLGNDSLIGTVMTYHNYIQPEPRKGIEAIAQKLN